MPGIIRLVLALGALAACAPQLVPLEVAEAECTRAVLNSVQPTAGVTIGVGTSNRDRRHNSSGVSMSATFPVGSRSAVDQYASCVQRRSGQAPVTPLAQRPELRG